MKRLLARWTDLFVVWVVVFSLAAYLVPAPFAALARFIVPALGIIMFGMGVTLVTEDFVRVARMPHAVACGLLAQFIVMPAVAWTITKVFNLSPELAVGFIIVGACPGGTASNVISYLAKADVALSVTMTACSTLMGIVLTPLLIRWLGGHYLPVDAWGLFMSVVKIVFIPVTAGFLLRFFLKERTRQFLEVFPALSVLVIVLVIAAIVATSRDQLATHALTVAALVFLHNTSGLLLGYGFAAAFRLPTPARRAIAIEVGMQNSGLGVALAKAHFTSPLVALPGAIFSVVHNLTGSALANVWRRRREANSAGESSNHAL